MEEELENTELDLETLRTRADVLFVIENYSDALEYYLKFYNANPKDLLIVNKIATCYLKLKKYDNAIKYD